MKSEINRRSFLKTGVITGSALLIPQVSSCALDSKQQKMNTGSKIVIAQNKLVRNQSQKLDSNEVFKLLNAAMEEYFQIESSQKAWSNLFDVNDVVGLKINCLAGRGISTSSELVEAIIENLLSIGLTRSHIIVWDRANYDLEKAGYAVQTNVNRVRYIGNDYSGYTRRLYESRSVGSFLSNILVKECNAIINIPILKDHGIVGITNALKNFFGAIHNPNKYHGFRGDPYIADVNLMPDIRHKVRITICDALTTQYEGGPPYMPQWTYAYNGIIVGQDMVALDSIGWQIIEEQRKAHGFKPLKEVGREPTYIVTAGDCEHGLGISDIESINFTHI